MVQGQDPLDTRLFGQGFECMGVHLSQGRVGLGVDDKGGVRRGPLLGLNVHKTFELVAQMRFAQKRFDRVVCILSTANQNAWSRPKSPMREEQAHAPSHEHDHQGKRAPCKEPPKPRSVPAGDGHDAHVQQGHGADGPQDVAQFVPKGSTVDVVLVAKQKNAE